MPSERIFYKNVITFTILSQEPIPEDVGLKWIGQECDEGSYVGSTMTIEAEERTPVEIVQDLLEVGSEPLVFQLDVDGNDLSTEAS